MFFSLTFLHVKLQWVESFGASINNDFNRLTLDEHETVVEDEENLFNIPIIEKHYQAAELPIILRKDAAQVQNVVDQQQGDYFCKHAYRFTVIFLLVLDYHDFGEGKCKNDCQAYEKH